MHKKPLKLLLKLVFGDSDEEVMEMIVDSGDGDDECRFWLRR
jgi:hypothetical protein